jgi:hypothetical protein
MLPHGPLADTIPNPKMRISDSSLSGEESMEQKAV